MSDLHKSYIFFHSLCRCDYHLGQKTVMLKHNLIHRFLCYYYPCKVVDRHSDKFYWLYLNIAEQDRLNSLLMLFHKSYSLYHKFHIFGDWLRFRIHLFRSMLMRRFWFGWLPKEEESSFAYNSWCLGGGIWAPDKMCIGRQLLVRKVLVRVDLINF